MDNKLKTIPEPKPNTRTVIETKHACNSVTQQKRRKMKYNV